MIRTLFLSIVVACGMSCYAQNDSSKIQNDDTETKGKIWKEGFVVKTSGDTVRGKIRIIDIQGDIYTSILKNRLTFTENGKIVHCDIDQIKEFSYYRKDDTITKLVTYEAILPTQQYTNEIFAEVVISGRCKVYSYTENIGGGMVGFGMGATASPSMPITRYCIKAGSSDIFSLRLVNFKKEMKELFAVCPVIVEGLNSKKYTFQNFEDLANDYNKGICK